MKKTQLTDAKRNIRRQIISYISIVVIALVAVSAYLGIAYPAVALRRGASDYLNRFYMWDLEVTSTLLMDQEELETVWNMRRALGNRDPQEVTEMIIDNLMHTRDNKTFIEVIKKYLNARYIG